MAQNEMRAMRGMPLRVRSMEGLGFFEFLEGFAILVLPSGEPVGAAAMNDGGGCAWAAELDILGEGVDACLFDQGLFLDQSLPKRDRVWVLVLC